MSTVPTQAIHVNNTFIAEGCELPEETLIENMVAVNKALSKLGIGSQCIYQTAYYSEILD